jgi:putative membrane protein
MTLAVKIFVVLAGLLHVAIFAMESLFFMHESVYSRFLIATPEHAQIVSLFAYNQGWYNLFLAIAALTGAIFTNTLPKNVGASLCIYACLSMLAAALVLAFSANDLLRAAISQGFFPFVALVLFVIANKRKSKTEK